MKGDKILVFGGTTEGRVLARRLMGAGYSVSYSVATEYGREMVSPVKGLRVLTGRLQQDQMVALIRQEGFSCVVDATHPYADVVSRNIRGAAQQCRVAYHRLLRPAESADGVVWADSAEAAADYLSKTPETALLTTGSKDLLTFARVPDYQKKLWVRILPSVQSLQMALQAGFPSEHIICMQGPFTTELNAAMMKQTGCTILVTKDSGKAGGFAEKADAARLAGGKLLVIRRPVEEDGLTLQEITQLLCGDLNEHAEYKQNCLSDRGRDGESRDPDCAGRKDD